MYKHVRNKTQGTDFIFVPELCELDHYVEDVYKCKLCYGFHSITFSLN